MRRTRTHAAALFFVAAAIGASAAAQRTAAADPPPVETPRSAEVVKKADDLFREGLRLVAKQRWAEAEERFLGAWALNPTYDVANNLGHTEYRLGRYRDAAEHFAFALRTWPLIGKKEPREAAEKRLAEVRGMVGSVAVRVNVAGAAVTIDGKAVGESPIGHELFVEPGAHAIEVKLAGYGDAKVSVECAKGSAQEVKVVLERVAGAGAAGAGVVPAPPGSAGAKSPAVERGGVSLGVVIAGGALAGVGVIVGGVLAGVSNGKASDAAEVRSALVRGHGNSACSVASPPASCRTLSDAVDARDTLANAAAWSFIGAGAIGVGTLIYALAAPRGARKAGVMVLPMTARTGGGLTLAGAW